jgi:hypothetical protein
LIGAVAVPDGENLWVGTFNLNGGGFYHGTLSGSSWVTVTVGQNAKHVVKSIFVDPQDALT